MKAIPTRRFKSLWTKNDAIITLYYYYFGFEKIRITMSQVESFVNEFIGSTESSLKMHCLNFKYLLEDSGLSNYSQFQLEVLEQYGKYNERDLRTVVIEILDNTTEEEKAKNRFLASSERKEEVKERVISSVPDGLISINDISNENPVNVGDILNHKIFGIGEVLSVDGKVLNLKFESTNKKVVFKPEYFEEYSIVVKNCIFS